MRTEDKYRTKVRKDGRAMWYVSAELREAVQSWLTRRGVRRGHV
jgi:hypothetical protein